MKKMSDNHSEEELLAQLQLALVPTSTSVPTFNFQDVYWEFLDRALHSTLPMGGMRVSTPHRPFVCCCGIVGGCGARNRTGRRQPRLIEFQPRFSTSSPFKERENPKSQCLMCFDDLASNIKTLGLETQLPSGITCPRNHQICRTCLDNLIIERCNTVLHTPSTPSQIDCPSCQAARSLRLFDLLNQRHSSTNAVSSYTEEQLKHACGGASKAALELLESVAQADKELAALPESEQITNGNSDCYLCPKCKFGPVAHQACSDLLAHHGSQGVSNKCPKCGFLGSHISEWIQIAEPRAPALTPYRPRAGRLGDDFMWEELVRLRNRDAHDWQPRVNGYQRAPERVVLIPSVWPAPEMDRFMQLEFDAPFQLHVDPSYPSYWDAPMRRLMQAAWQAAEEAGASRLAITDGSQKCVEEEQSHAGSWGRVNQDAWQVSLVQESHRCLRVTCSDNLHSISQWLSRDCIETALCPVPRQNFQRRTQKCLTPLAWETQLFIRLFEKALLASVDSINTRMAIKNGSETDGMEWQMEMRREKQLACPRVL